jgi:hypothetical protein
MQLCNACCVASILSCSIEVVKGGGYIPDLIGIFPGLLANLIKLYGMNFHKNFLAFAERKALNMMAQKVCKFCESTLYRCAFLNKQGKRLKYFRI